MSKLNKPPRWCPDAVPSDRGWRHPKTGELLVSVRGGVQLITAESDSIPVLTEDAAQAVIDENVESQPVLKQENEVKEIISEDKPKRGRKKNA